MGTQVKKAFQPIVDLLEAKIEENPKASIKSILADVIDLTKASTSRGGTTSFKKDASGAVVAIHDYYFKRWMPLVGEKAVEFGAKAKTTTGFNTMSKVGVSLWTKQQREAKQAEQALLNQVASGEVAPEDIPAKQAEIEEARKRIEPTDLGFENEDDLLDYLADAGVKM